MAAGTILRREKAAFFVAADHSLMDNLKEYTEARYTGEEFEARRHIKRTPDISFGCF